MKHRISIFFLFLSLTQNILGDSVEWQGYVIHYTTLNSMLIPPAVAKAHDIVRSERRIVTNITIRKDNEAVKALVKGYTKNLFGQIFTMRFDQVEEPKAIYYLSNQLIDERDILDFEIDISPSGLDQSYILEFRRQYF